MHSSRIMKRIWEKFVWSLTCSCTGVCYCQELAFYFCPICPLLHRQNPGAHSRSTFWMNCVWLAWWISLTRTLALIGESLWCLQDRQRDQQWMGRSHIMARDLDTVMVGTCDTLNAWICLPFEAWQMWHHGCFGCCNRSRWRQCTAAATAQPAYLLSP